MPELTPFWSGVVAGCAIGMFVMQIIMERQQRRLQAQFDEAIRLASEAVRNAGVSAVDAHPAPFSTWAAGEGYDIAQTYDTERSRWVFLNPMTADLWKAWQAARGVAGTDPSNAVQVDRGALQMALNVLRRAGKNEVADALAAGVVVPQEAEVIAAAHDYLRDALGLPEDAPRRFDYYAHCIEKLRANAGVHAPREGQS